MAKCAAITQAGTSCKGTPMPGESHCYVHHPDHVQERQRYGSKGGKRGGRGRPVAELNALRTENGTLRQQMLDGDLDPRKLAVAVQSINTDIRCVEVLLKAKEQDELEERMTSLEETLSLNRNRAR